MATGDVAFMMPMLEMSSKGHIRFVEEILYDYNVKNPISDFQQNRKLRARCSWIIRRRKPYEPLKKAVFLKKKR